MQKIHLSIKIPRSEIDLNQFPLYKGLKFRYFMGYFSMFGLILTWLGVVYILYIVKSQEFFGKIITGGIIFSLLWSPFILFYFLDSKKYFRLRKEAIVNGIIIKGKIIEKKPLIRSFLLKIEITKPDKTTDIINYGIENFLLYNDLKINSVHTGLWNPAANFYTFPFEMGVEIIPKN